MNTSRLIIAFLGLGLASFACEVTTVDGDSWDGTGGNTGSGTGGGTTSSGTTSSGTTSSSGGTCTTTLLGLQCENIYFDGDPATQTPGPCTTCAQASCCNESNACLNNNDCAGLQECLTNSCASATTPEEQQACLEQNCPGCLSDDGLNLTGAWMTCLQTNCPNECGGG